MTTEFSCPVSRATLVKEAVARELEASLAERQALAERFELAELSLLRARLAVERLDEHGLLRVAGEFEAHFAETCVVTLRPVPRQVRGPFELIFTLEPSREAPGAEVFVDAEGEDPPEPVGADGLDLGEIVVQHFSLHLEPYPRAPEAHLEQTAWSGGKGGGRGAGAGAGEDQTAAERPFAALRNWRR